MAGIYIHIPFCKQACYYCDFHFSTSTKQIDKLIEALVLELKLQQSYLTNQVIESIYFGGGTPSLLSTKQIKVLLETIEQHFTLSADEIEITLEANPDDLTKDKLIGLKHAGINRLSIGVQSFSDSLLQKLNRSHTSQQTYSAIENAHNVGIHQISLDLIFCMPEEFQQNILQDLELLISLVPDHISPYTLTIEERTVFSHWLNKGSLRPKGEEQSAEEIDLVWNTLQENGYEQYEISNFARNGSIARHNSNYWRGKNYLGCGPSAHSYNGTTRQFNITNNAKYILQLSEGAIPYEIEHLTTADKVNELIMTGIRTRWGCDIRKIDDLRSMGKSFIAEKETVLDNYIQGGFMNIKNDVITLTHSGKKIADSIAEKLFI